MKDIVKIEHTVSTLIDIVDTLMSVIKVECLDTELVEECKAVMKNLKHNWQDEF